MKKGSKHSVETIRKIRKNHRHFQSKNTRIKISISHKKLKLIGEKCCAWKGDKVGIFAIHQWVAKHKLKSKLCEFCGKEKDSFGDTKLELANIKNHQYTRNPDDYKWGHSRCHQKLDIKLGLKKRNKETGRFIPIGRNAEGII